MANPIFNLHVIYYTIINQYFINKHPTDQELNQTYQKYFPEQNKLNFEADGGIIYRTNSRHHKDYYLTEFLKTFKILMCRLFIPILYITGSNGNIISEACDEIRELTYDIKTTEYEIYQNRMISTIDTFIEIIKDIEIEYPETIKTIKTYAETIKRLVNKP